MLHTQSVKKLIRDNFSDNPAIKMKPEEIKAALARIRETLLGVAGVKEKEHYRYYGREDKDKGRILHFEVREPGDPDRIGWSRDYSLDLRVDQKNELTANLQYSDWQSVSDISELVNYIRAYQAGLQRKRAKANKRQKLRDLKTQAIIAQIKNIAKEEGFDFVTQADTVKLKLFVKLSDTQCLEMEIPFSKFQQLLPNIRTAIQSLRTVHQAGIRFKIGSIHRYGDWIEHKKL
ncbi:MAG: hypothetical protein GY862_17295 [Gammaproteobacteria bacterium]|nr:hypothetical protein [Gammaproteobacteria bacterium]